MLTRCRSIRTELDRLDDQIDLLDRDDRAIYAAQTAEIRVRLDQLEQAIEAAVIR